jgi:hypothetical protein
MLGLTGVFTVMGAVLTGRARRLTSLELSEPPSMPFMYWLAVMAAIFKPKWTAAKAWPALRVAYTEPRAADPGRLSAFRKLAGWPAPAASKKALPSMFMMAEGFKLVMAVLTLPAFPVSILGTVVNKRARYTLLRDVAEGERLLYRLAVVL